jgi:hypothetical protein
MRRKAQHKKLAEPSLSCSWASCSSASAAYFIARQEPQGELNPDIPAIQSLW